MTDVFLSLGSNLGDRYGYLQYACRMIDKYIGFVAGKSSVYESAPWGFTSGNLFYNQVLQIYCAVEVTDLLRLVQRIEGEAGRERSSTGYTDRTLDIDILFYGDNIVSTPELTIPHPYVADRRFVLEPLCELAPYFIHPVLKVTLNQLLEKCKDTTPVCKIKNEG